MLPHKRDGFHGKIKPCSDGPLPSCEDELIERVREAFLGAGEEWQAPFQIVRLLKAFFKFDYQKALEFTEGRLGDYLDPFDLSNQWGKVTNPAWCFEVLAQICPMSWDHPELEVRNNKCHSRRIAGMAFYLQSTSDGQWFRLGQIQLSEALGISHQMTGRILNHLVKTGWLLVQGRSPDLQYQCPHAPKHK
jgi:hypothetical protein